MLTKLLIILHKVLKVKDSDKFFKIATGIVLVGANILDVLIVLFMAAYVGKLLIVLYAVIVAMLIRVGMGEHYKEWLECLVSGWLIYTIYAFSSIVIHSPLTDIVMGIILAIFMIDFKSEKAQQILKRIFKAGSS